MRLSFFLAVVSVGLLSINIASAKEKKMPAPQWAVDAAKTPTPAAAGDAAAVVLFDEDVITVDEQHHTVERERRAVRILKPQGREHAHCSISYDVDEKLNSFHAWTIAADGRQFQALDEDFADHGNYAGANLQFSEQTRVVDPPASDPGAVVACETEQQLRPYMSFTNWAMQDTIPIVHEALELDLPPGEHATTSWRGHAPVKPVEPGPNRLRWEIDAMPRLSLEDQHATPVWAALVARMTVFWGPLAVEGVDRQWQAIGEWGSRLEAQRAEPTPEIAAKAKELVDGAPDLYTKLSRITQYIQKNVRYFVVIRGIGGWQAHPAESIFRNHYGDCKDKTTLLIAMLKAVGIDAYYLHVDARRGVIDPRAPSLAGNHMITAIALPESEHDARLAARVRTRSGKTLLAFDPTDEETPVGLTRPALQGAWGNIFDGADSQVLALPVLAPETAGVERTGHFVLAESGDLSGTLHEDRLGEVGGARRGFLKENPPKETRRHLETDLGGGMAGVTLKSYEFHQTEMLDRPLGLDLAFSLEGYAKPAGRLLLLNPRVLGSDARRVPEVMEGKPRLYPVVLGRAGHWRDHYEIAVPEGYVVDELPSPVTLDAGFASYHSAVVSRDGALVYEREYVVRAVEIPAAKAEDFRAFEAAIMADENGAVVLKK